MILLMLLVSPTSCTVQPVVIHYTYWIHYTYKVTVIHYWIHYTYKVTVIHFMYKVNDMLG